MFKAEEKADRAVAWEKMYSYLMEHLHILVGSRIVKLDQSLNMGKEIHQMIGAPKKKTEAGEEAPIDMMANWLKD